MSDYTYRDAAEAAEALHEADVVVSFRRNRGTPELNRQFGKAIREMDRNLAPLLGLRIDEQSYNKYTYSSGEHHLYGRIERNY